MRLISIAEIKRTLPAECVSIILTIIALLLWIFSLASSRLVLDSYGLVHSLPFVYFTALALLTISSAILWPSRKNHNFLLFFQLFFLIVSLWLTPLLIGGIGNSQQYFPSVFAEWGNADYIIRNGHFAPEISWRLNFPGVYILGAEVASILGIENPTIMITLLPFIWQLVLFLPLYSIFRNVIGKEYRNWHWAALWVLFACGWSEIAGFHTQTVSNLLLLVLLALCVKYMQNKGKGWEYFTKLGMILVIGALVVTHLNTPLVAAAILCIFAITRKLDAALAMIAIIFIASWLLYGSTAFFNSQISAFFYSFLRLDLLWSSSVTGRLTGSPGHQDVVWIRLLVTVIFGIIGLIGYFLGRRKRANGDTIMLLITIGAFIVALIFGPAHGFETPQRYFFFILPPLAYFATKWLHHRFTMVILVCVLIVSLPFYYIAHYGNQEEDFSSPATIASWEFFNEFSIGATTVSNGWYGAMKNIEEYQVAYLTWLITEKHPTISDLPEKYPQYICLGEQDQKIMEEIVGLPDYIPELERELSKTAGYNIVYTNPDVRIYLAEASSSSRNYAK